MHESIATGSGPGVHGHRLTSASCTPFPQNQKGRGSRQRDPAQAPWQCGGAESRGAPPPPQDPSPLRGTLGSSLRSPPGSSVHGVFQARILEWVAMSFCLGYAVGLCCSSILYIIAYICQSHPPIPSLWVIPVHQPQASCILHRTWTGDSLGNFPGCL